jgi:hypothetical protein
MSKIPKKKKTARNRDRVERRFLPLSTTDSRLLYLLLTLGALISGAGAFAYWGREGKVVFHEHAFYALAVGAILIAAALWFSSGSDAAVRVGAPGVAIERGGLRRMPWYEVASISWAAGERALTLSGKDESGAAFTFPVSAKAHPAACAWIVAEAKERIPAVVELDESVASALGPPDPHAGIKMNVPVHVVGKRCAVSGEPITYEPDARVCPQCERVYHKYKVPKACKCGAGLQELRDKVELYEEDQAAPDAAAEAGA